MQFEDFLNEVFPPYREFVTKLHEFLLESDCACKLDLAKNGCLVSYSHAKSKRVILNFVFRKGGLVTRIYGDHVNGYPDFMQTLPEQLLKCIDKAPACKRMLDPAKCNSRCSMGYAFTVGPNDYKKCRYNCFMFPVNDESIPFIRAFVENEINERTKERTARQ